MRVNSLAFRLFATAAAWTLLVLPVAGLIMSSIYKAEVQETHDRRIMLLLTVLLADSLEHAGEEPGRPGDVGEPLFGLTHSGWYWQIAPVDFQGRRLVSESLASGVLERPSERGEKTDDRGTRWSEIAGPLGERLRIAEQQHSIGEDSALKRYSFAVAGPLAEIDRSVSSFTNRLMIALALAGLGLVAVTLFQVRFGLLPLRAIEKGLAAVRSGDSERLDGVLPAEIEPLQSELNALIASNQDIVERARTQVGNLAHALKTPLAVIVNEAREDSSPLGTKVVEQAMIMREQIDFYLERARMAARAGAIGRVADVRAAAEPLVRTIERIHRDKGVRIALVCPSGLKFQGEKQDLEEMLGILLDNACKFAETEVRLAIEPTGDGRVQPRRLVFVVDDDGPGLTPEQRARLGKRGVRLDESKPGSGLGLSIVIDFAHSYRGAFALDQSPLGGLRARLELPQA